jgi:hypothetical protein
VAAVVDLAASAAAVPAVVERPAVGKVLK